MASPADGVALHTAGVSGRFEDPAFGGFFASAARETAFRPRVADTQAMAAPRPRSAGCFGEAAFKRHEAGMRGARIELARHMLGVKSRAIDRLLQVHAVVDMV